MARRTSNAVASAVGWLIVVLLALWLFGLVIGWIRFLLRSIVWLLVIGALVVLYLRVKDPPDA